MVEFLTPLGWLAAAAALVPAAAAVLRARRDALVRSRIGLPAPRRAAQASTAVAATIAAVLLAAATARPAVRTSGTTGSRTDAQVFFVVDVSRSMLARLPHGRTRYQRALAAAERLRARLPDVPAGIASLTDRPLPHLFPTADRGVFSAVLQRAIGIERPAPEAGRDVVGIATSLDSLDQVATTAYFSRTASHRLLVLLSDGESAPYAPATVDRQLCSAKIRVIVVRFWAERERVYTNGRVEPYRPNPLALRPLEQLAAGTGGRVFDESRLSDALRAARSALRSGPTEQVGTPTRIDLAPYLALAAVLPVAFVLRRRD